MKSLIQCQCLTQKLSYIHSGLSLKRSKKGKALGKSTKDIFDKLKLAGDDPPCITYSR